MTNLFISLLAGFISGLAGIITYIKCFEIYLKKKSKLDDSEKISIHMIMKRSKFEELYQEMKKNDIKIPKEIVKFYEAEFKRD
jgi:hypothetical protein